MKYIENNTPYVCMQTNSSCYKWTEQGNVIGVLFHSTGANNPNLKRYVQPSDDAPDRAAALNKLGVNRGKNDWNHIKIDAGLNAWIGKFADGSVGTVQTMPWDWKPWGCGEGKKGSCNDGWIQFEICEDNLKDASYFNEVYKEACELTAYLCKLFKLDPNGVLNVAGVKVPVLTCHADAADLGFASHHADVNHWFSRYGKSMQTVRDDVFALLGGNKVSEQHKDNAAKTEQKTTAPNTTSPGTFEKQDNSKAIWDFLMSKLGNAYAVAGIMGNLYAESGLRSNNLQNSFEKKLGMDDVAYTAAVDSGAYGNFVRDSAGYGLAQWTYWSRKQNLLNFARAAEKSIGDLSMQLDFLWMELQGYKPLMAALKAAKSVYEASTAVLLQYEKPADQSEAVKRKRAEFGSNYYKQYAQSVTNKVEQSSEKVKQTQAAYSKGDYVVVNGPMRLRSGPGIQFAQLKFRQMTISAQMLNKAYADTGLAFYKVGTVFTALQTQQAQDGSWWAKNPSGWICLADSKNVYCKRR